MPKDSGEKVNWDREQPATPLSVERVADLLAPWLGRTRVMSAELLKGGLMNRNIRVRLDRAPYVCVLRLYDGNPAACTKEIAVHRFLSGEVPVPEVLFANTHGDGDEPPFVVLTWVEGKSLVALRRADDADAVAAVSYDAGRVLARIQALLLESIPSRHSGPSPSRHSEFSPSCHSEEVTQRRHSEGPTPSSHSEERSDEEPALLTALDPAVPSAPSFIDQCATTDLFRSRIGATAVDRLESFVERREETASRLAQRGLVHGDYNSPNIFGHLTDGAWRVSAVLDWEFAFAGSCYSDIGNFLRYHRRDRPRYEPDFSRGLRDGGMDLPNDWLALARFADLPACCELLTRRNIPDLVVLEVSELVLATLDDRDI